MAAAILPNLLEGAVEMAVSQPTPTSPAPTSPAPTSPAPTSPAPVAVPSQAHGAAHRDQLVWVNLGLALATALAYVAIGLKWLPVGIPMEGEIEIFPWVAAAGYTVGGLLILLRRRWLWITGWVINALVLWMYVSLHWAEPWVLWSAGGIVSKIPQALLVLTLLELIVLDWRLARTAAKQ
jgi:hypothetical protein